VLRYPSKSGLWWEGRQRVKVYMCTLYTCVKIGE
jgi:hypothetical protein